VTEVMAARLPWTLVLVGSALAITTGVGVLLGAVAARRRGQRRDLGLVGGLLLVDAMAGFWIGMVLIAVFAVQLGWFPSFGAVPLGVAPGSTAWLGEVARRMVLPVATIVTARRRALPRRLPPLASPGSAHRHRPPAKDPPMTAPAGTTSTSRSPNPARS
jgi:ABC-type dipeptide/oligopeptide/nickel transport system permease component